jgi:hypothetical protein
MQLHIKNSAGKKVDLTPIVKSRGELAKMLGGRWFILAGSDYEYNVNEVIAEPSPDTTVGTWIFSFFALLVITHLFFVSVIISGIIYMITLYFRYRDREAVKRFNNS